MHARVNAPFDNEIWDNWFFTSNSEESMVRSPQGNRLAVVVHGGGIFATTGTISEAISCECESLSAQTAYTGCIRREDS